MSIFAAIYLGFIPMGIALTFRQHGKLVRKNAFAELGAQILPLALLYFGGFFA